MIEKDRMTTMSEREIFNIIFLPGFSTAAQVSNISGRGVGMDVVKTNIEKIGGSVELNSKLGQGTSIRLKIPLTLAIVPAMIVASQTERYAIPQVKLVELVRIDGSTPENKIELLQGKPVYRLRGNLLPLVGLKDVLGFQQDQPNQTSNQEVFNIVVLKAERQMFGLIVDEIQDTADIVVKPLSSFLKSLSVYSGATVLGDGSVALILDVLGIAQRMHLTGESSEQIKKENQSEIVVREENTQEFLLFKLNSKSKHAVPLDLVHRLEEFKRADIEFSGDQPVMRYCGAILPIISLNEFLKYPKNSSVEESEFMSVIVTQKGNRYFGIEVNEILDVLRTEAELDEQLCDRKGILGGLIANEEVIIAVNSIEILDQVTKKLSNGEETKSKDISQDLSTQRGLHKILYAEDNAFFRKHITGILQKAGYSVTTAFNGSEALSKLEEAPQETYSMVLSDIEMPRMNGLELATNIRKEAKWKDLPLIALTTLSQDAHVEKGKQAGFNSYLEKLNPEILLQTLDQIVAKRAA